MSALVLYETPQGETTGLSCFEAGLGTGFFLAGVIILLSLVRPPDAPLLLFWANDEGETNRRTRMTITLFTERPYITDPAEESIFLPKPWPVSQPT
jgi:hypothetical protein